MNLTAPKAFKINCPLCGTLMVFDEDSFQTLMYDCPNDDCDVYDVRIYTDEPYYAEAE